MRCRRCGTELPSEARFCMHCGAPMPDAAADDDAAARPVGADHAPGVASGDLTTPRGDGPRSRPSHGDASFDESTDRSSDGALDEVPDATHRVPADATVPTHGQADETRVARRREETVVRGETTRLGGEAPVPPPVPEPAPEPAPEVEPEEGPASGVDAGTQPMEDPLDAVEDPYADLPGPAPRPAAPVPPPEPERRSVQPSAYIFIAIAAVIVAAVLGAFVTWRMELWGGTTVPDVMGLSEAEATARLADAGFEVAVAQVVVDEGVGTVVSMEPQAGRRVATGRTVEIGIGTDRVVPEVEGLDLEAARAKLNEGGIDHLRLEYQVSSAPKGSVTAVSPVAGTKVAADEVVTLVVAQPYTVPDVVGLTVEGAEAALERAGLEGRVSYVPSDTVDPGRVVSTDPVAGTEMDEGAVVALSVSSPYPASLFDLAGYLTAKPEDISTFLGDEGYAVSYGKDVDGVARMTWERRGGAAQGVPAIGFTPLPFSLPSGFQLFPQDVIRQGARIDGVYLQIGEGANHWDIGSLFGLGEDDGPDASDDAASTGAAGGSDQASDATIDSRATGGEESIDLDVSQDCIAKLMNLCGLRSTPDTTTTATQETIDPTLGGNVDLAAKAGVMDGRTWYVVVWEPVGRAEGGVRVSLGMAPTDRLLSDLASLGVESSAYGDSMASLAASLVLSGGVSE